MSIEGFDCASSTIGHIPALKAAGMHFACRYVSSPGNAKNLTKAEADALKAGGLDIVVVFETTAQRALGGKADGITDATNARAQAHACGAPASAPIYFAVDFDAATVGDRDRVKNYISGAASVLGKQGTGVYGGIATINAVLDAGICEYAWGTYAWSGGRWDPRAQLQQYKNGVQIGGITVDRDRATRADYGQWHPPKRIIGYTVAYIDKHGEHKSEKIKHPAIWMMRHRLAKKRGRVTFTRRLKA